MSEYVDLAKGVPALHPERKGKLDRSPKKNWVEKSGGLPPYINSVATALVREGKSREEAIQIAVNMAKKTCASGRIMNLPSKPKVSPAVQAAFCKAVEEWERKKAGSRVDASAGEKLTDYEFFQALDLDVSGWPGHHDLGYEGARAIELSDDEWSVEDFVMEGESVGGEQWLLPFDFSEATRVGASLFKKQIAPLGATIDHDGRTLEFTKPILEGIVETFKQRPVDYCPFTLVNDKNQHTDDPERERGVVEDLSLEDDGLYMIARLDDRGRTIVDSNPNLGVSMRYAPQYEGPDGTSYKHALLHVAGAPRARLRGMKPWEPWGKVELSDSGEASQESESDMEVIDLTEAHWDMSADEVNAETEEDLSKEKEGGTEVSEETKTVTEEVKAPEGSTEVNLSEDKVKSMIDLAVEDAVKSERERAQGEISALRMQNKIGEVDRAVAQFVDAGVPPFVANLAAPLLLENEKDGAKVPYLDLSEGAQAEAEASRYELVTKILTAWPKEVDLSEENGTQDSEAAGDDADAMWKAWRERSAPSAMGVSTEGGDK